jgi:signal transduction histidine kinase
MDYLRSSIGKQAHQASLFHVAWEKQTYINILYLLISFPLGICYFVFLIIGLIASTTSLAILGVLFIYLLSRAWWRLGSFERTLAMEWLHIDIRPMSLPPKPGMNWWERIRVHASNPVTWKILAYLLIKFPLGILSFVVIINMLVLMLGFVTISLTLGLIIAPFVYLIGLFTRKRQKGEQIALKSASTVEAIGGNLPWYSWQNLSNHHGWLLPLVMTGFGFAAIAFHVFNALAAISGQFAQTMLGMSDAKIRLAQAKAMAEEERAKAEQAERSRRELIINVSHELRTPVASIRGHVESLLMAVEDEGSQSLSPDELRDYLAIVYRESERLSVLVDDLLSLARLDADKLHLDIVPIPGGEVVEEVYTSMAPLARRERQVTLVSKVDPMLPYVLADRQRLAQVLLNLVRNAIAYTPQGGIVSIALERADAHHLVITVADTGIGIPSDELERIFERFYRTDASRARSSGGFGLGLTIVRDLVEAMEGTISVESKVGEGSCFRVLLPVAVAGYHATVKDEPFA